MLLLKAAVSRVRTIKTFGAPGPVANHHDPVALPHLSGGKPGSGPPPAGISALVQHRRARLEAVPGEFQPKGDPR